MENYGTFQVFKNSIKSGSLSHAYIFQGFNQLDRESIIKLAQGFFCPINKGDGCGACPTCKQVSGETYPDIYIVKPDPNTVKTKSIEKLILQLNKKSFMGMGNLALIFNSDTMTIEAQNRLLKTLEEPAQGTVLVLLTENISRLLPTIVSRCIVLNPRGAENQDNMPLELLEMAEKLGNGLLHSKPYYELKAIVAPVISNRDDSRAMLDALEIYYRNLVVNGLGLTSSLEYNGDVEISQQESSQGNSPWENYIRDFVFMAMPHINKARQGLQNSYSVGYTIKNMILKIGG